MRRRIRQIRKDYGLSQEKFAKRIGMSGSFFNQVETGKNNVSDRTIADICREFHVNENWLRTGEGEMYSRDTTDELDKILDKYELPRELRGLFLGYLSLSSAAKAEVRDMLMQWASDAVRLSSDLSGAAEDEQLEREARAEAEEYYRLRLKKKRQIALEAAMLDGTGANSSSSRKNTA